MPDMEQGPGTSSCHQETINSIIIFKNVCKSATLVCIHPLLYRMWERAHSSARFFFSDLCLEYSCSSVHIMFQYLFKNKTKPYVSTVSCEKFVEHDKHTVESWSLWLTGAEKKLPQTLAYIFKVKCLFSIKNYKILKIKIQNNPKKHTKHKNLLLKNTNTFRSTEYTKWLKKNLMLQGWVSGRSQQTFEDNQLKMRELEVFLLLKKWETNQVLLL